MEIAICFALQSRKQGSVTIVSTHAGDGVTPSSTLSMPSGDPLIHPSAVMGPVPPLDQVRFGVSNAVAREMGDAGVNETASSVVSVPSPDGMRLPFCTQRAVCWPAGMLISIWPTD